jgi:aryl-alcohol dehydrogenase-like predicted oxidoreductase
VATKGDLLDPRYERPSHSPRRAVFRRGMERRILGGTGISVSSYALGTMMLGAMGNTDHDESVRMIHTALDAGINFVDTADVYSGGESEVIVGKALKGRRDDVVLATKFGLPMGEDPNHRGASPRWIRQAVTDSLRRLDTDHIDLYQLHRPDHGTDIDETLAALSDLVREGKVRAIGSSFFSPEETVEARWAAERRGHHRFRTEQPPYSILTRGVENRVLPTAQRYGIGVLTFGPLNSGWLSGRADPTAGHRNSGLGTRLFDLSQPGVQAKADAVEKLTELAADAGMSVPHLAIAFVRAHPAVTSLLIGPRRPDQLADLLAGADVELSDEVLDRIDEIVPPGVDLHSGDFYISPTPPILDKRLRRR